MQCALPQLADTERAQRGTEAPGHTARMCCRRSGPCRAAQPPGAWGGARGPWYRISQAVFQQCFPSADSLSLVGGPSHPTELGKASPVPCYPPQGGTGGQPHRKPAPGEEGWWLCVLVGGGYKGCPRALPSEGHLPARTGLDKAPLPRRGTPFLRPGTAGPPRGSLMEERRGTLRGAPWLLWSRGATWWPLSECASLMWRVAFRPEGQQPCR